MLYRFDTGVHWALMGASLVTLILFIGLIHVVMTFFAKLLDLKIISLPPFIYLFVLYIVV